MEKLLPGPRFEANSPALYAGVLLLVSSRRITGRAPTCRAGDLSSNSSPGKNFSVKT